MAIHFINCHTPDDYAETYSFNLFYFCMGVSWPEVTE